MKRLHLDAHFIFDATYIGMSVYVVRKWMRWSRTDAKLAKGWRQWATFFGFALSNVSLFLILVLSAHSVLTDGFPPYHPTLMLFYLAGFVTAFFAVVAAIIGKGQLENATFFCSLFCILIWFAGAIAM